jgi:enoyl-CoA hydratase/carnithine racemase
LAIICGSAAVGWMPSGASPSTTRCQPVLLATTGERIDAAEALRIGLFDRVYSRSSFEESWRSLAALIASSPSRSIKSVIAAAAPH